MCGINSLFRQQLHINTINLNTKIERHWSINFEEINLLLNIHLKSVNEVGHLLYFAGTNSWLILKDQAGQTLSSHAIVK